MTRTLWLTLTLLAVASPLMAQAPDPLLVKTDKGEVRGELEADGHTRAFKAIPFAAPPVGDLRWKPPQPAASWTGIRDAKQFGVHCLQSGGAEFHVFRDPGASEDCLTLDVWTPANTKRRNLPVIVWIYGGGFGQAAHRSHGKMGNFGRRNTTSKTLSCRHGCRSFALCR